MSDQKLADVMEISETYTGCLRGRDGKWRAAILRPHEGLFLAKRPFLEPGTCFTFAESCLQVPVPYNDQWFRINPDHWWK